MEGTIKEVRGPLAVMLLLALLASAWVTLWRVKVESQARRVELIMDYADFSALARSYSYNEEQFLVELRRAGLTSLAIAEELGSAVNSGTAAIVLPGQGLIDAARLSPLADPKLAALAKTGGLRADEIYLVVYDARELGRYRRALSLHFGPNAVRVVRDAAPTILAIRSQIDFFNALGLGLPAEPVAMTRRLALLLVPRVQNDERFNAAKIGLTFDSFKDTGARVNTVIFFGQRNEVLGFPDHLDDTAEAFRQANYVYGLVETYDKNQVQKGSQGLGERIPTLTTRVLAVSKVEQDNLGLRTRGDRYRLGVREGNGRAAYRRPIQHPLGDFSIEKTNVEYGRAIAEGLQTRGFKLGRATPVRDPGAQPLVIFLVSLAIPAIVLLGLAAFGRPVSSRTVVLAVVLDAVFVVAGYASHHDLLARKMLALLAAIAFATAAVVAISPSFRSPAPLGLRASVIAGLRTLGRATVLALAGALIVVGLLSVPVLMEEIDRFTGVKAVIVVPPLLALGLYLFTSRFGTEPRSARATAMEPVRFYQLSFALLIAGLAFVYIARSGNTSDIAPSAFELSLRSHLTAVLGVRPRFKEFLIGFPLMMLLPAVNLAHRRAAGWLFALGIGIGTADIIDTFSHLHTPITVSLLRLLNGAVAGILIGVIAIVIYRRLTATQPDS